MSVLQAAAALAIGGVTFEYLPEGVPLAASRPEVVRPALFVPEQLERVTKYAFTSGIEVETALLTQTRMQSAPPKAVESGDAAVLGGKIFAGGRRYMLARAEPYRWELSASSTRWSFTG